MLQKRRSVKFLNGREKEKEGRKGRGRGERESEREPNPSDLQDNNINRSNIHIIRISESGEGRRVEKCFGEIMAEKFPNVMGHMSKLCLSSTRI